MSVARTSLSLGHKFLRRTFQSPSTDQYSNTTFTWEGKTYECTPGVRREAFPLESGGFEESQELKLGVLLSQFPVYTHEETLLWSSTIVFFSSTLYTFSGDKIDNPNPSGRLKMLVGQIINYQGKDYEVGRIELHAAQHEVKLVLKDPHASA